MNGSVCRFWGLAIWLSLAVPTSAQELIWEWEGDAALDFFGSSVSGEGDIDGDGTPDIVVGARGHDQPFQNGGRVYVYSGASGDLIFSFGGVEAGGQLGVSVSSCGDVNDDGFADVIAGAPGQKARPAPGAAVVVSGADGTLLYSLPGVAAEERFGASVAFVGDVNLDGCSDFLIGGEGGNPDGRAHLYSGKTGLPMASFYDKGYQVAAIGNVDNDGFPDYAVGEVNVYSGPAATPRLLLDAGQISRGADLDGDGVSEIFTSRKNQFARVLSGVDGTTLWNEPLGVGYVDGTGATLAVADLNGDGAPELLLGGASLVYLFVGNPPQGIRTFPVETQVLASAGDLTGNLAAEFIAGESRFSGAAGLESGRAAVYCIGLGPRVDSVDLDRSRYDAQEVITVSGGNFLESLDVEVSVQGRLASEVEILDDTTLSFVAPVCDPGPGDLEVFSIFGRDQLPDAIQFTPSILPPQGDFTPGGSVQIDFLVEPGDAVFCFIGPEPCLNLSLNGYAGSLGTVPIYPMFNVPVWPFDRLVVDEVIVNDPSLVGASFVLQILAGPTLFGDGRDAAFSNCQVLTIE